MTRVFLLSGPDMNAELDYILSEVAESVPVFTDNCKLIRGLESEAAGDCRPSS